MLASMVTPSLLLGIGHRRDLPLLALAGFLPVLALAALPVLTIQPTGRVVLLVVAILGGWLALSYAAFWLARSVQRAADGIERLRTAHDAERRSTDAEAELRSGARMVHDTVLSTLTLIAHSGEGVRPQELREQARADVVLLGELRTHGVAVHRSVPESLRAAGASPADASWSAVDSWHSAHGLSITWHGADQLDLPPERLDALVRAASECLENVRRHSGVSKADVMLSQDARMARAVVTDSGVGFVREQVPGDRLGVAQSIEARVHAVGGTARIFTSPGRGTTVLLEVPR
jgi:signal transduction histidine kinase